MQHIIALYSVSMYSREADLKDLILYHLDDSSLHYLVLVQLDRLPESLSVALTELSSCKS